ncbi:MAG: iron-sulfur cluster repair di-iron protein [Bacteroidales bacterium]|nr:iron-sulfur cluster repair di-iron protein [Bacteroidales bacterium]
MKFESNIEITIGEIVAKDFRAAKLFKEAGIDFCCGGYKFLSEACKEKGSDLAAIIKQLNLLTERPLGGTINFNEWELGFLSDYIINTHHNFVRRNLPELSFYTQKIAQVHGDHHPELLEVAELFAQIQKELLQHLIKEEEIVFPAIKKAEVSATPEVKTIIISEVNCLRGEHEFAGGAMDKIAVLTNRYHIPSDACNTYRISLKMLEQFENDLHIHVHLENNILYPKAIKLAE